MSEIKWIKITTNIFDNRKIQQIEALENGDSIIVIWLKILTLAGSLNDNGMIYLTPEVPYTEEMLAAAFKKPITTIRLALDIFKRFKMIEIEDDIIYIANWEKYQNIEGMKRLRDQSRERVAKHRELKRLQEFEEMENNNVTQSNGLCNGYVTRQRKNKKKNIDIDNKVIKDSLVPSNPSIQRVVNSYNSICTKLPEVRSLTEKRKQAIQHLLKSHEVTEIEEAFKKANDSNFLTGVNDRGWKANLDFILREDKFVNILEGAYTDKSKASRNKFEESNVKSRRATKEEREYAEQMIEKMKEEGEQYEF